MLSQECISSSTPPLIITLMLLARETHLDGREGGDDGGRAKAVRDHAEVGEVPLYRRVEYLRGPRVAQRRAVLVQQVHQLFRNYSAKRRKTLMNHESRTEDGGDRPSDRPEGFCPVLSLLYARPESCDYAVPNWAFLSLHFWLCKQAFGLSSLRHLTLRSDESMECIRPKYLSKHK